MEIKSIQQSGYTLRILTDDHPDSPANWSNLGQIAHSSSRYTLGTEAVSEDRLDEIAAGIEDGSLIGLPVYAYVHGGATISTRPFSCPWDSGQSGFVYCRASDAEDEWAGDPHFRANALRVLSVEVKAFDQYLRGDVYGYVIEDKDGDVVDSCWGFYGIECAEEEARSALNYWAEKQGELFAA
jgi:hypothetical protein